MPDSSSTVIEEFPDGHDLRVAQPAPAAPAPAPAESARPGKPRPSRRRWVWASLCVLLVLGLAFVWSRIAAAKAASAAKAAALNPDRKSTRLNSSHLGISYAVFCLKKKHIDLHHYILASALSTPVTVDHCPHLT